MRKCRKRVHLTLEAAFRQAQEDAVTYDKEMIAYACNRRDTHGQDAEVFHVSTVRTEEEIEEREARKEEYVALRKFRKQRFAIRRFFPINAWENEGGAILPE